MLKLNSPHLPTRLVVLGSVSLACLLMPACKSKDETLELIPVSGKVMIGTSPMPLGQITFHPDKDKGNTGDKIPSGMIQTDGTYKIQTGTASGIRDGAPPGWYKVTISAAGVGTPEQAKAKPPNFNPDFSKPTKTKLSVEVKQGAAATAYEFNLAK